MNMKKFLKSEWSLKYLTLVVMALLLTSTFLLLLFVDQDEATPGSIRVNVLDDNDVDTVLDDEDVYGEKIYAVDRVVEPSKQKVDFDLRLSNPAGQTRTVRMDILDKEVDMGGNISRWSVNFFDQDGDAQDEFVIESGAHVDLVVEVKPPTNLDEDDKGMMAEFSIGGYEKFSKTSWANVNLSQNFTYNNVTLKVIVGLKSVAPLVTMGDGEENELKVTDPNKYTYFAVKLINQGSQTDSYELDAEFVGKTRGAIGEGWFVKFDPPSRYVENLKSLDSTEISVGIKPPVDAERGSYDVVVFIRSDSGRTGSITLTAKVPKPELAIVQISASPSPALERSEAVDFRVKVKNSGSAVIGPIPVTFSVQYDENEGWTPVGQAVLINLENTQIKVANVSVELQLPDIDRKTLRIIKYRAEVDEDWQIPEDNKNNNVEEAELEIVISTADEDSFASTLPALVISVVLVTTMVAATILRRRQRNDLESGKEDQE